MASKMAADSENDEQTFINEAYENALDSAKESYADENYTLKEDQLYSSLSSDVADWLFDASRTEGDTTYIVNDSGVYYVLYFVSRSTNDYLLPECAPHPDLRQRHLRRVRNGRGPRKGR